MEPNGALGGMQRLERAPDRQISAKDYHHPANGSRNDNRASETQALDCLGRSKWESNEQNANQRCREPKKRVPHHDSRNRNGRSEKQHRNHKRGTKSLQMPCEASQLLLVLGQNIESSGLSVRADAVGQIEDDLLEIFDLLARCWRLQSDKSLSVRGLIPPRVGATPGCRPSSPAP